MPNARWPLPPAHQTPDTPSAPRARGHGSSQRRARGLAGLAAPRPRIGGPRCHASWRRSGTPRVASRVVLR
eukprot:1421384-Prymnesium_polylepis.1